MRTLLTVVAILFVALSSTEAHAQFANKSLGLSVGYMKLNDAVGYDWGLPIGFNGTLYIENGFDLVAQFLLMVITEPGTGLQRVGIAPSLGVRYLFSEETFRPYAGAGLSYLHIFSARVERNFVGLAPNVGFEYFVADTVSLGLKAQFNAYVMLNTPVQTSVEGHGSISTYF